MSSETRVKQVIVMRHDLKMRRGKQIAQGAHAAMSFLCRRLQALPTADLSVEPDQQPRLPTPDLSAKSAQHHSLSLDDFGEPQRAWLTGSFAKVCCRVNSEEELMEIYDKAQKAGLEVHLITDSGKTEFHGQPTRTCLAIGPDIAERIDEITGHLQLL